MTLFLRRFFKRLAIISALIAGTLYLAVCLVPYVNTGKYWYLGIIGLGFPLLFFLLVMLLFYFIIRRSRWWIFTLVVLVLGWQQIRVAFAFHPFGNFNPQKHVSDIRVMQWNVHNWQQVDFKNLDQAHNEVIRNMMSLIDTLQPDIICIEEFFESEDTAHFLSAKSMLESMGFVYHYFDRGDVYKNIHFAGLAIFSKWPIIEKEKIVFENDNADPLLYADVLAGKDTLRVFAAHLQSVRFDRSDYRSLSEIKEAERKGLYGMKAIIAKLRNGFQKRYNQAQVFEVQINESPYPVVVCGDFNTVPNSHGYFTIKGDLQDAFLKEGFFLGRTFRRLSPTLRIDYIFSDRQYEVSQFHVVHVPFSDHYPIVADLQLYPNN